MADAVRIAVGRGIRQVADDANGAGQVLAQLPAHAGRVRTGAVGQVDELAPHVGERLVDGPGLVVVEEVGAEIGHAVGQLVAHHVVGRHPLTVHHLRAVPEGVGVGAVSPHWGSSGWST